MANDEENNEDFYDDETNEENLEGPIINKEELLNFVINNVKEIYSAVNEDINNFIKNYIRGKLQDKNNELEEKKERNNKLKEIQGEILFQDSLIEENILKNIALTQRIKEFLEQKSKEERSKITKINVYFKNHPRSALKYLEESYEWWLTNQDLKIILYKNINNEFRKMTDDKNYESVFFSSNRQEKIKKIILSSKADIINCFINRQNYEIAKLERDREIIFELFILKKDKSKVNLNYPEEFLYYNEKNDYICSLQKQLEVEKENLIDKGSKLESVFKEAIENIQELNEYEKIELLKIVNEVLTNLYSNSNEPVLPSEIEKGLYNKAIELKTKLEQSTQKV